MVDLDDLIEKISYEFHADPKNKVFASENLLLTSVKEEIDKDLSVKELRSLIQDYKNGDLDGDTEEIYDAAVYCCGILARKCFAEDAEDEDAGVNFEISWIENEDETIAAEIRPS